jgi:betaine reductase
VAPRPVVLGAKLSLAHVPDLVRHGSKPTREVARDPEIAKVLAAHRRDYAEAVSYPPNQVFIGNLTPHDLWELPRPWFEEMPVGSAANGPHGEIMQQADFYCLMAAVDDFDVFWLTEEFVSTHTPSFSSHPLVDDTDIRSMGPGHETAQIHGRLDAEAAIAIHSEGEVVGCVVHAHPEDPSLDASILLENLAAKASATLALRDVLRDVGPPESIEYLFGCGEEAVGDRYQRGGGNLAKAVGEAAGCTNATGSDVKAFCCAPNHAIVIGAGLVSSGLYRKVAVVGGGSLPKLGMKFQGAVKHEMPILEDVLACAAVVLGQDDSVSPVIDLNAIGAQSIGAGSSPQAIAEAVVSEPLAKVGLRLADVDRYSTELHNPEVMEPQGSGDVAQRNYRVLASLAVRQGDIERDEINDFVRTRGMPGFSPTQGHIASALPFLAHARDELTTGDLDSAFFYAKGSLFLGRMTKLSDGFSFLLRRNTGKED